MMLREKFFGRMMRVWISRRMSILKHTLVILERIKIRESVATLLGFSLDAIPVELVSKRKIMN